MLTNLLLVFFLILSFVVEQVPCKTYTEKDMRASVLLHMKGTETKQGKEELIRAGCSGTYIDSTHILSAAHCFEGYHVTNIWARGENEANGYPVHLMALDLPKDLAILESPYSHYHTWLGRLPKAGDEVINIGSPYNFEFVISQGVVGCRHVHIKGHDCSFLLTTAMINPGSSGGGVFDKHGRLVGVNTISVGIFGWSGISLAVDVDTVRKFLEENKRVLGKA